MNMTAYIVGQKIRDRRDAKTVRATNLSEHGELNPAHGRIGIIDAIEPEQKWIGVVMPDPWAIPGHCKSGECQSKNPESAKLANMVSGPTHSHYWVADATMLELVD
jgi:hypothetical protein